MRLQMSRLVQIRTNPRNKRCESRLLPACVDPVPKTCRVLVKRPDMPHPLLTGIERRLPVDDLIVSKTDLRGRITYANQTFLEISGYAEDEIIGKPHNIIRHPQMPRCVFKYLWDTIAAGREVFAYVVNRCKNGDHYWVFAHVTPTFDAHGRIVSYHSNRRAPLRSAIQQIELLYRRLLAVEQRQGGPRDAWQASLPVLVETLHQRGVSYDEFVFSLSPFDDAPATLDNPARGLAAGISPVSRIPGGRL
jgi:PAS domain S-box-containing protein